MKTNIVGSISKEEVDVLVKEFLEKKLGTKITHLTSSVKQYNDPTDWRSEYPPMHTFDGYSFNAEDNKK